MRQLALAIVIFVAVGWLAAVLLAPVAASHADPRTIRSAALVYAAGSVICHQRAERSFHVVGTQLPVCARCTGLYVGGALGAVLWATFAGVHRTASSRAHALATSGLTRRALLVLGAPTLVTVATATLGAWDPGNGLRAVLAVPLGGILGTLVAAVAARDLR